MILLQNLVAITRLMLRSFLKRSSPSLSLASLIITGLLLTGAAQARTIYVSTAGNDGAAGSIGNPLATPARALDVAAPGDTIYLRGGTYNVTQQLTVLKSNLTIASYQNERATLAGGLDDLNNLVWIILIGAPNVQLLNLEIVGGSYYGIKIVNDYGAMPSGARVKGCRVRNTGRDCIKAFNADDLVIEDSEIGPSGLRDPSNAEGIDLMASIGATVRNCYIHNTATNGLYYKAGTQRGIVENCRIENVGLSGILLGQDSGAQFMRDGAVYEAIDCVARNNVIVNTKAAGLGTYSGYNVRFENNTVVNAAQNSQAGFYVVTNQAGAQSQQVTFKNNIVILAPGSSRPLFHSVNLADQLNSDHNIWYSPSGNYRFWSESYTRGYYYWWSFSEFQQGMNADWNSKSVNPQLDSSNEYKALSGSPAIDAGETIAEVSTDFTGQARPQGLANDIGAYEAGAQTQTPAPAPTPVPAPNPSPGIDASAYYEIIATHSGKPLDVPGLALTPVAILQWDLNGGLNQQWQFVPVENGYYKIVSRNSGKVLDIGGGVTSNGGLLIQYDYLNGDNQKWQLVALGDGSYKIVNKNSGLLLDVAGASSQNGASVLQWSDNGGANQKWRLIRVQ